jgi:hypothetical protein
VIHFAAKLFFVFFVPFRLCVTEFCFLSFSFCLFMCFFWGCFPLLKWKPLFQLRLFLIWILHIFRFFCFVFPRSDFDNVMALHGLSTFDTGLCSRFLFLAGCCGVLWEEKEEEEEEEEEVLLCIHIVSKVLKFCWARVWRFGGRAFCRSSCFVWQKHPLGTSSSSFLPGYFWTDCY